MVQLVIAGGGLSGLSAAARLVAEPRLDVSVLVVDDGSRRLDEAAWAFWSDRPGLLDAGVTHCFDRVRVHAGGRTRVLGLGRYRYRRASGSGLIEAVRRITAGTARFTVRRGHVEGVEDVGDGDEGDDGQTDGRPGARVLVDGEPVAARWVLDSVLGPPRPRVPEAQLVFRGWRVRAETPAFDDAVPTLFDFRTPQREAASFIYVLPTDRHHALVEHTTFAGPGHVPGPSPQAAALGEYLDAVLGVPAYTVLGEEHAVLPLSARPVQRRHGNVLTIGAAGGMVKASTGYAYQRIQRDSAAIAGSLAAHGHPFALPRPSPRHRLLDGALLDVITRDPGQLERAFTALFRHASAEPVLRFLDEDTSVREESRLFAGMPIGPFLAAVARRAA